MRFAGNLRIISRSCDTCLGLSAEALGGDIFIHVIWGNFTPLTRGWQKKVVFSFSRILYIGRKRPEWWKCERGWERCKFVRWFYWQYQEKYCFQGCFWLVSRSFGAKMESISLLFPVRPYRRSIWGGNAGNIRRLWGQFTLYRYFTGSLRTALCHQYHLFYTNL